MGINLAIVGALVGAATIIYFYYRQKFSFWSAKGINGPKPIPFFGNIFNTFTTPLHDTLKENRKIYGKIYGMYSGTVPELVIGDPELIKLVTVKDAQNFLNRRDIGSTFDEVTAKMMSVLRDEDWRRVRTLLSPTFTSSKMKRMFHLMDKCSSEGVDALKRTKGADINLKEFFGKYSLDVIANCAFATNPDSYRNPKNTFFEVVGMFFNIKPVTAGLMMILPASVFKRLGLSIFPASAVQYLSTIVKNLINERQEKNIRGNDFLQMLIDMSQEQNQDVYEKDVEATNALESHYDTSSSDLIKKIAINEKALSENEIIANAILFLVAGYNTAAELLTFVFYSLALNHEIQEKLFEEIKAAGELNYEKLASLPFLDAIVQETLRMYPATLRLEREAKEDYNFPGTDITIPKKTIVSIPVSSVHYDPEFYPEPEIFDPTRFLPENRSKLNPYAFLAFGHGPRNCIGMRFALLETKLMIARTVLEVRIKQTLKTTVPLKLKPSMGLAYDPLLVAAQLR